MRLDQLRLLFEAGDLQTALILPAVLDAAVGTARKAQKRGIGRAVLEPKAQRRRASADF